MFADVDYPLHPVHFVDHLLRFPNTTGYRLGKAIQKSVSKRLQQLAGYSSSDWLSKYISHL